MFRFGFNPVQQQEGEQAPAQSSDCEQGGGASAPDLAPAEEVLAGDQGPPTGAQEGVAISADLTLFKGVISNAQAATLLSDGRVEDNDLIAGVYEGGFKTWEGGLDLARFLAAAMKQQPEQPHASELAPGHKIMELGCGSGLPGLVALWADAEVHFQDYNRSVITTLTMQNVAANQSAWATRQQAAAHAQGGSSSGSDGGAGAGPAPRYFAGSWDALPGLLREKGLEHTYDAVLTAETIYSLKAMRSLYAAITACLRPGTGVAYVAAKSYYFGVGGGTAAFMRLVAAEGRYDCRPVAVVDDRLSVKREILKLTPL